MRKSVLSNFVFFVDLAREEACTEWAERNEADSKFLEGRQNLCLGTSPKQRIFALNHLTTKWSEGFAHEFLVCERPVRFSGIEECDAAVDGRPDEGSHFLFVRGWTIVGAHPHTAEPDG